MRTVNLKLQVKYPKNLALQFIMASDEDKLLFRMRHIIPRLVSDAPLINIDNNQKLSMGNLYPQELNVPEEVAFQMTWGKVAAKIWGPPDGRPVFAIHGWLDNSASFDTLIPLLPKNLRIVVVDTPGCGLSDTYFPDICFNFLDCVVAIERLAMCLKWKKFSLIGHSLGGCMAMFYAGIFPEKVEKFVTLDVIRVKATIPETVDYYFRKTIGKQLKYENDIISRPEKPMSYDEAVQKSIEGSFGSLDEKACHILFKRGLKKVEGGYVFSRDRKLLTAPMSFGPKEDLLHLARKVTADVLVIKFTEGPYFESEEDFLEHLEALKVKSKDVRFVEVEGKHHAHLTHPECVAPIISEFFNS